jgi:hypothetical protein
MTLNWESEFQAPWRDSACSGILHEEREYLPLAYPCQTWLPQEHVTVSVGCCLVNCFLQMWHGLVITYIMVFTPWLNHSTPGADSKFIVPSDT